MAKMFADRHINSVVALSYKSAHNGEWETHATGFIYGKITRADEKNVTFRTYLITNKHVLENEDGSPRVLLYISANIESDKHPSGWGELDLIDDNGIPCWHANATADIAVIPFDYALFKRNGSTIDWLKEDIDVLRLSEMKRHGISEGESIYLIGFPGLLPETKRVCPVFRDGIISRIQDAYAGRSEYFVIDANVSQGNSGGPVLVRPSPFHIAKTDNNKIAACIGIVSGHWNVVDESVNLLESTGLGKVWTIDAIDKIIDTL